jgi:hypothetical protein
VNIQPGEEWFIVCGGNTAYEEFLAQQGRGKYDPKLLWMGPGPGVENWHSRLEKFRGKELKLLVLDWNWFNKEDIEVVLVMVQHMGGEVVYNGKVTW